MGFNSAFKGLILLKKAPGCGSEDVKKECNVNCFDFFFFSVPLMNVMGGKITVNLKELH